MRAWFGVPADKFLPSLIADAEDEVASALKGLLKILMGKVAGSTKSEANRHYRSTLRSGTAGRFGKAKTLILGARDLRQKNSRNFLRTRHAVSLFPLRDISS
jgi:hypothetical protein